MWMMLFTWLLKKPTGCDHLVILSNVGIQLLQGLFWIALKLHYVPDAPLRCGRNDEFSCGKCWPCRPEIPTKHN